MKRFKYLLVTWGIVSALHANANDLKTTLAMEGFREEAKCVPATDPKSANLILMKRGSTSFLILSAIDKAQDVAKEMPVLTEMTVMDHDAAIYEGDGVSFRLARVGENPVGGRLQVNSELSALRIWLKAYATPNRLTFNFLCELQ